MGNVFSGHVRRSHTALSLVKPFLLALTLFTIQACPGAPSASPLAGLEASPLLVTFELADEADAAALSMLAFERPATFFLTGAFAERHPTLVRELAAHATIGSLGFAQPDLTGLDPDALHRELLLGKLVVEQVIGRPVEWFRAPALASSAAVFREAKRVGFRYDSSDLERWGRQGDLHALPVSTEDRGERPASDHALFQQAGLSDADALAWLIARYEERATTGRPLVLALRPGLSVLHRQVFDRLVAHVDRRGGELLTAQGYVERAMRVRPSRFGVWVDLSQGPHDAAQLARDVQAAGITDVFLQAKDPDGNRYYAHPADSGPVPRDAFTEVEAALRPTDVRVHAWIAVARDPYLARRHPAWAMTTLSGGRSADWIAPSHPDVRAAVRATVSELLDRFPLAGIHLDYLRYPGVEYDFSPDAVARFRGAAGLESAGENLREMFDRHYNSWIDWRCDQITAVAADVASLVASRRGPPVVLSAALYAEAATRYRVMEAVAQDYSALARHLDAIVPMAYLREHEQSVDWISQIALAARYRVGRRDLLAGLEAYQRPPQIRYDAATFRAAMDAASYGYAGQVFYAYSYLFGRGAPRGNMPAGSLAALSAFRQSLAEPSARARFPWIAYPIVALVFGVAAVAAARGRAARARRQRARSAPGKSAMVEAVRLDPEWLRVERQCDLGSHVDGEHVRRLLQALTPFATERLRAAYLIESLGEAGQSEAELLTAVDGTPLSRRDVVEAIERAGAIGAIELREGVLRPTARGQADLEAARAGGYRRTTWRLVENLLGAECLEPCPACHAPVRPRRPAVQHGCPHCGFPPTA
jgi:peptidoglycan/xylan/chitin deacetylase (PgdA/CDA1 family)